MKKIVQWPYHLLDDEEMESLFVKATMMINLRPLSAPSTDPRDPPPLRPADFLLTGRPLLGLTPEVPGGRYKFQDAKHNMDDHLQAHYELAWGSPEGCDLCKIEANDMIQCCETILTRIRCWVEAVPLMG